MKKMIWLTTISILFIVFVIPGIFAYAIDMVPASNQPGYDSNTRLAIYGIKELTQKFISEDKNLMAIGTSIRNPNLKNKKAIIFSLYDQGNNLIRSVTLNGLNVEDGAFVKFVFQPIPDSKGAEYSFTLASPDADSEQTIEVFIIEPDGGIPMVTFHKPDNKWEIVKAVYASLLSR